MSGLRLIGPHEVVETVSYTDLIETVAEAFRAPSEGRVENDVTMMYPVEVPSDGDVMAKTAALPRHPFHVVRIAPWFAANAADGRPQGRTARRPGQRNRPHRGDHRR